MSRWNNWGEFYEKKPAKAVKGGIKAQSKSGAFGKSWWAQRWIGVLESFDIGARLQRGRSYARRGQVASLDIAAGQVTAKVQGSSSRPYKVTIEVKQLTPAEWQQAKEALQERAAFVAKLLAGEMPQDIEEAFMAAGVSLFPAKLKDLETDCSCPDWSNPCKHIAAVYYLLGEEFDRDPFLLFKLRGQTREELVGGLSGVAEEILPPEPLPAAAWEFWQTPEFPPDLWGEVAAPPVNAGLLKRLGRFPLWRGQTPVYEALAPYYEEATSRGQEAFLADCDKTG